jgi:hypothetical protein
MMALRCDESSCVTQERSMRNVPDAQFPADDHAPWVKHDRGEERADLRRSGQLLKSIRSAEKSEPPNELPLAP